MGELVDPDDLVGPPEIADRLGIRHAETVHAWRRRYVDFPMPVVTLRKVMLWKWSDVEHWARKTDRLPRS